MNLTQILKKNFITKAASLLLLSICSLQAIAQQYFVPFVDSNKMYLVNENGEKVINKNYDDLQWEKGKFFIGSIIEFDILSPK